MNLLHTKKYSSDYCYTGFGNINRLQFGLYKLFDVSHVWNREKKSIDESQGIRLDFIELSFCNIFSLCLSSRILFPSLAITLFHLDVILYLFFIRLLRFAL